MTLILVFVIIFTCRQVAHFWNVMFDTSDGTCRTVDEQETFWYAHAAVVFFVDMMLGVALPIHVLHGLQMGFRVKATAACVTILGLSAGTDLHSHPEVDRG
jgi:hypothetical protein